jgi:glycosyltransferase involved in cell wall biosynthesis
MMSISLRDGPMSENRPLRQRSLRIVIGAHTPHGTPYVVGSHHLARELKRMGHMVFHVPIPLGPQDIFISNLSNVKRLRWDGWKTTRLGLDPVMNDQFLLAGLPWVMVRRLGYRFAERLGFGVLTSPGLKALVKPDILIVDHPKQFWLVKVLKPAILLYRPTDAYSFPGHKDDDIYKDIENWLLQRSNGVVLTASETTERMLSLCKYFNPPPMRVLENGVDLDAFTNSAVAPPSLLKELPSPRVLYIGTFDNRIDYEFIIAAARRLTSYSFVLGGPMTANQQSLFASCNNITLLGSVAYGELSRYMKHCDIGFMPMNDHPFNATRSPMKLYEFAACGLPMVAKATAELTRRNLPFCFLYEGLTEFCSAIDRALAYKLQGIDEMRKLAREKSWDNIASQLIAFCDEISPGSIG